MKTLIQFTGLRKTLAALAPVLGLIAFDAAGAEPLDRTSFQTGARWDPMLQLPADVAMCYGVGKNLPTRIAQWKGQGYAVHLMTGVSWGQYQDYLYGKFDGQRHVDEAQMDRWGKLISHGGDVYYMCPGPNFGKYLAQKVVAAIDAGAEAIHLEEPEFWARAGYGGGFRRAWKDHYHEDWIPPHESPQAQYRASQLKYTLYRDALKQVFEAVREHNAKTGKRVKCYVATHSLINYAQWGIVSPESSLLSVGADGYIAQVWTGTSRTPNLYEGVLRERTFETAFLEYGAMVATTRGTQGKLWLLHDPVEDNPDHSWADYRTNWECTVVASLLWPQTSRYEVAPWPERIFHGKYPKLERKLRKGDKVEKEPIPPDYATELLTVMNALNDMEQADMRWDCGTRGIGVVVSDAMMFQRSGPSPSERHLSSFFGLALPMVERGIPLEPFQLETLSPASLVGAKVLLMTYEGMKPMTDVADRVLADWVRQGGALVFIDDDRDPYNGIAVWWNKAGGPGFRNPREALFEALGLGRGASAGAHKVGKGIVAFDAASPATLAARREGAEHVRGLVHQACDAVGLAYREANHVVLHRGPYLIGAGLEGSGGNGGSNPAHEIQGRFVDLLDPRLAVAKSVVLTPGRKLLMVDLDHGAPASAKARVVASAGKILNEEAISGGGLRFTARGPEKTIASIRVALARKPGQITLDGAVLPAADVEWDDDNRTALLRFPNAAAGRKVTID